jgi:hypothetical protein
MPIDHGKRRAARGAGIWPVPRVSIGRAAGGAARKVAALRKIACFEARCLER